ncbi:MAG: CHASE2 domain-containing protein [Leptolyngbya sp. SIO1E4]|nr:CHASE2 domain-containing protein [Leptolyngbya sp. SIO1E4]
MTYRLSVHKIEQSCLFELTWGQGQRISASLPYPNHLTTVYQTWRRAYISYYRQALRGRLAAEGQVASKNVDWHSQVVQAEARLLLEFHKWLRHEALFELRAELVKGQTTRLEQQTPTQSASMSLFLACSPLEIARLPWETWEMGADLGQQGQIQMVRSPSTIRSATVDRQAFRKGKTRVLTILGDERGLNLAGDRAALEAQKNRLEVHYVGWHPHEETGALKERICQAIADPKGWDVLFFAGHSNEAALVDGQIAIAPNTAIAIRELTPYLNQAKQRGLQFALFNSCSGLDIASRLIDLGLSQVAIMREPIHNDVAQAFLVQFLQRLARFEDVESALVGACQFLKLEKNLTYPSAYLVPSLFRHPDSVPYQIQPTGWRTVMRRWLPNKREALAVGVLALLSLFPPVHHRLLNYRMGIQARYRDWTAQLASTETPVVLVQIDDRTLQEQRIAVPNPIDRTLLADIVTTLTRLDANVISIDYVLDRPQPAVDSELKQAFEQAVSQQSWIVLAQKRSHLGEWLPISASVASPNWSLQGDIWSPLWHIRPRGWSDQRPFPFSYQAATAYHLALRATEASVPRPSLDSSQSLQSLVASYAETLNPEPVILPQRAMLHPITNAAYPMHQRWLQPLLDFSLPPNQVYHTVPAWQLLQNPEQTLQGLGLSSLQDQLIIVAPGGYDEAGFTQSGEDNLERPQAIAYWHQRRNDTPARRGFTGGEIHAYMAHHFLSNHLVVPIPDFWMVLLAVLIGKGLTVQLASSLQSPFRLGLILSGATMTYGLVSLQLYVSGAVMLPWLLPSLTLVFYGVQLIQSTHHDSK